MCLNKKGWLIPGLQWLEIKVTAWFWHKTIMKLHINAFWTLNVYYTVMVEIGKQINIKRSSNDFLNYWLESLVSWKYCTNNLCCISLTVCLHISNTCSDSFTLALNPVKLRHLTFKLKKYMQYINSKQGGFCTWFVITL